LSMNSDQFLNVSSLDLMFNGAHSNLTGIAVRDDEVLVAIKKTGKIISQSRFPYESLTESRHLWFRCMSLLSVHHARDSIRRIRFITSCMEGLLTSWWRNRW
jgi:hypothetical protein